MHSFSQKKENQMKKTQKRKVAKLKMTMKKTTRKRPHTKKIVMKSPSVKAKVTNRKSPTKKLKNLPEVVPLIQSPKAAEVNSPNIFDATSGFLKNINERLNSRSGTRHQSR